MFNTKSEAMSGKNIQVNKRNVLRILLKLLLEKKSILHYIDLQVPQLTVKILRVLQ